MSKCPDCGRSREWGCMFECSIHLPPERNEVYASWADEQKQGYLKIGAKVAEEQRQERAQRLRDGKEQ